MVSCGNKFDEVFTLIKSVMLITKYDVLFHLFTDDKEMNFDKKQRFSNFFYKIYAIQYPPYVDEAEWKTLFKPCATQRIFLPLVLASVDSIIYLDTDVLFLQPINKLWDVFETFNAIQISSMTKEHEEASAGWYNRFARHPFVPPYGINSGVMLMNLTRMRDTKWVDEIISFHRKYKYDITWGDQDLINIYFHFHPDKLHEISCNWNYRPDHCMYMSTCKEAEVEGIFVVHGNRGVFHNENMPTFKAVYDSLFQFPDEEYDDLIILRQNLENNLKRYEDTRCGSMGNLFLKNYEKYLT
ncbi:hypothetical protein HELRODRAFT_155673 [Helobdella robusta]|uniref:UDP-D-xylose:beta-D-glucoside alpha-1,3-D-xylosyltransferase n=1 Tax=Helobdella robusta TaxID=6412 RepID=T1ELK3_HELRO|nr:hypothetical protein HELRODRAFT_155673 [Helobdella robusta]ESO06113.1 hypothetical protein HELRODRAFT_155673 [Helobdella robusta]